MPQVLRPVPDQPCKFCLSATASKDNIDLICCDQAGTLTSKTVFGMPSRCLPMALPTLPSIRTKRPKRSCRSRSKKESPIPCMQLPSRIFPIWIKRRQISARSPVNKTCLKTSRLPSKKVIPSAPSTITWVTSRSDPSRS